MKQNQADRLRREAGFTLVEIMVVIVILGLLATMVASNVIGASDEARIQTTRSNIQTTYEQVKLYASMEGHLPDSLEELENEENKRKPWYLERPAVDAWDQPLLLVGESKHDFEIISIGPDGSEGSDDDISSRAKKE
ncbi:MAG: type II secretion system protein GspG [Planctomycetes bacterium]|nr:type II secretion system protein GspG [Planctomycetota bacterium]